MSPGAHYYTLYYAMQSLRNTPQQDPADGDGEVQHSESKASVAAVGAALYLIPSGISEAPLADVIPSGNMRVIAGIRHFIVENLREARRFLKRCDPNIDIDALTFSELNRHTDPAEASSFLQPLREGEAVGVLSDAGCPAVADPGAIVVGIAQREGYRVIPLVGPSSILMALMGSGFNGQGFSFQGYLPVDDAERSRVIRRLEEESRRKGMTQIFIETPYRNSRMLRTLAETLGGDTGVCVACDITAPGREYIVTRRAAEWKRMAVAGDLPPLDKRPAIFLIYAGEAEDVHQTKHSPRPSRKSKKT